MDMSQYYGLFVSEAREHLRKIGELTLLLEADPTDRPTVDALFRSAHSIKGMAASMSFAAIADLAHRMEDLMARIRNGLPVDTSLFDLLLAGADQIGAMIDDLERGGVGVADTAALMASMAAYSPLESPSAANAEVVSPSVASHSVEAKDSNSQQEPVVVSQTVRVRTELLDTFVNTTGELITVKHRLEMLAAERGGNHLKEALRDLGRHLRDLHDHVMTARLLPLSGVTERFPRMVRELSRGEGKEIAFTMQGVEIELDRSILDVLGDPLAHLLRNCVDHGIEPAAARLSAGKPASGTLTLTVTRQKDQVEITVCDDGRGMDPEAICGAAVDKGGIDREMAAALSANEKLMLICHAGFSTASRVTEISGRGVGMDVVKNTLHSLGGTLSIASTPGRGSTFLLRLPLTVAIINVILVGVGQLTLAVPLTAVMRTADIRKDEVASIDGKDIFFLGGEEVPLVPLGDLLGIPWEQGRGEHLHAFIAEVRGERVGILVDRLLGHKEVFVKPLAKPLSLLPGINGATLLGDGQVVFILDILHSIDAAASQGAARG